MRASVNFTAGLRQWWHIFPAAVFWDGRFKRGSSSSTSLVDFFLLLLLLSDLSESLAAATSSSFFRFFVLPCESEAVLLLLLPMLLLCSFLFLLLNSNVQPVFARCAPNTCLFSCYHSDCTNGQLTNSRIKSVFSCSGKEDSNSFKMSLCFFNIFFSDTLHFCRIYYTLYMTWHQNRIRISTWYIHSMLALHTYTYIYKHPPTCSTTVA